LASVKLTKAVVNDKAHLAGVVAGETRFTVVVNF
jgi:hypothetical protein